MKYKEITQYKSFTLSTRGHGTVRRKCLAFIDELKASGFTAEIAYDQCIDYFQSFCDVWDRISIRSYFGVLPQVRKREFQVKRRYKTGTITQSTVTRAEIILKRKGYFEKLGLWHYELRGHVWIVKLHESSISPTLISEVNASVTMRNLSLSPIATNSVGNELVSNMETDTRDESGELRESSYCVRDINRLSESIPIPEVY